MRPEDPLGPIEGIMRGVLVGALLWASIALLTLVFVG